MHPAVHLSPPLLGGGHSRPEGYTGKKSTAGKRHRSFRPQDVFPQADGKSMFNSPPVISGKSAVSIAAPQSTESENKLTKSRAIKLHCLTCSGESPKEVTLCVISTCPLWKFRFGYSPNDKRYDERMQLAAKRRPKEYQEVMRAIEESLDGSISPSSPKIDKSLDDNDDEGKDL